MKFSKPHTLVEIANIIEAEFVGRSDFPVLGINEIHRVDKGDIVFVDHPKYYDKALQSMATIILINKKVVCPEGKALLISDDPFRDFVKIGQYFMPFQSSNQAISKTAIIGKNTIIQPNVFIGNHVQIGDNCLIHAHVCIYDHTIIGDNVTIHSGTVIGGDAFYFKKRPDYYDKLQSVGNIVIDDDVEIGSNCTIDKGVTATTTIGKGTKLDNLIQIGHDTIIGKNCLIASQVGIAGCCIIEDEVTIWGQVGIRSGLTLKKKSEIYAQSGLSKNTESGKAYWGSPAEEAKEMMKQLVTLRNLTSISKK